MAYSSIIEGTTTAYIPFLRDETAHGDKLAEPVYCIEIEQDGNNAVVLEEQDIKFALEEIQRFKQKEDETNADR